MQEPKVRLVSVDDDTGVELRLKLDLFAEPFVTNQEQMSHKLQQKDLEVATALARVRSLEAEVEALEAQLHTLVEEKLSLTSRVAELTCAPPAPRAPPPVELLDRPAVPAAVQPPPPPSTLRRITDTLWDMEVSFGLGHKIGRIVDRVRIFVGLTPSFAKLDDDDLYQRSIAGPVILTFLLAAGFGAFLFLGGPRWVADQLGETSPAAQIEAPEASGDSVVARH